MRSLLQNTYVSSLFSARFYIASFVHVQHIPCGVINRHAINADKLVIPYNDVG